MLPPGRLWSKRMTVISQSENPWRNLLLDVEKLSQCILGREKTNVLSLRQE